MAPGAILGLKSSLNLGLPDNLKNKFPELLFKGRPNYVFKKGIANYLKYRSRARCEPFGQKQQSRKFTLHSLVTKVSIALGGKSTNLQIANFSLKDIVK